LTLAQGCRTSPPGYIGWGAGTTLCPMSTISPSKGLRIWPLDPDLLQNKATAVDRFRIQINNICLNTRLIKQFLPPRDEEDEKEETNRSLTGKFETTIEERRFLLQKLFGNRPRSL
jgi:hypothetical protein